METVTFVQTSDISGHINALFEKEKNMLAELLSGAQVEHVGGTSIEGLLTKGDLDINVRVPEEGFPSTVEVLKKLYEIKQPENWTEGFASFKDDSKNLGVQVTVIGGTEDVFVGHREYLRTHPEAVEELNTLKRRFEGAPMDSYRAEKVRFLKELDRSIQAEK